MESQEVHADVKSNMEVLQGVCSADSDLRERVKRIKDVNKRSTWCPAAVGMSTIQSESLILDEITNLFLYCVELSLPSHLCCHQLLCLCV